MLRGELSAPSLPGRAMRRSLAFEAACEMTILSILRGFVWAVKGIPSESIKWWHDGHTRTAWLRVWQDTFRESGIWASYQDYRLWRWLGTFSDALILVILLTLVYLVVMAVA